MTFPDECCHRRQPAHINEYLCNYGCTTRAPPVSRGAAGVGFEMAIKRWPARCLDHWQYYILAVSMVTVSRPNPGRSFNRHCCTGQIQWMPPGSTRNMFAENPVKEKSLNSWQEIFTILTQTWQELKNGSIFVNSSHTAGAEMWDKQLALIDQPETFWRSKPCINWKAVLLYHRLENRQT